MQSPTSSTRPPVPSSTNALSSGGDPGSDQPSAGGAKNLWGNTDHHNFRHLNILTYNVRTLREDVKIAELEEELHDTGLKWDVIGLAEVRRPDERFITLKSGHTLYHTGASNGQQGVGFLIHKNLSNNIVQVKEVSPRVATLKLRIYKK